MNVLFIFLLMIFCHIVDDYYLQGWLASAKQKDWWKQNASHPLYSYDYIWALIMHSFSWSFMIMLPIAFKLSFNIDVPFIICFGANMAIHAIVDDLKANKKRINLWVDQMIHILQILVTLLVFILI
jgi:hypothetical protein